MSWLLILLVGAAGIASNNAFSLNAIGSPPLRASTSISRDACLSQARPPAVCASLYMSSSSDGKPQNKNKGIKLGPGLFAPDIQVGPEENWQKPKEQAKAMSFTRDMVEKLFSSVDSDANGKIDKEELIELARSMGHEWSDGTAIKVLSELDTEDTGLISKESFVRWYLDGKLEQLVVVDGGKGSRQKRMSRMECDSIFQMVDSNRDSSMDAKEFCEFGGMLGLEWDEAKYAQVFERLDANKRGLLTFDEFYAWYSSTHDLDQIPSLKEANARIFVPGKDDVRRVFIRGFPSKAGEEVAKRFFGRCGEVESVKMINIQNQSVAGRLIVTFKDETCVPYALEMHRFKMGKKSHLEVYRVNRLYAHLVNASMAEMKSDERPTFLCARHILSTDNTFIKYFIGGDKEEVHEVAKSLHGALIGIRGSKVQQMQRESGAKVFFEAEPKEVMIIKGTAQERSKAWAMAQAVFESNQCDTHTVDVALHGRLIGAKGAVKTRMETESGAHIVYQKQPTGVCLVYGTQAARERAWQLIQDKIWQFEETSEQRFPLSQKYHGMLTGKGGVTVKAIQDETGARIKFIGSGKSKSEGRSESDVSDDQGEDETTKGTMVVRGTPNQCDKVWKISQVLIRELPQLLSDLREEDIALGSLRALPLSPSQVWTAAVETAMKTARAELGAQSEGASIEAKAGGKWTKTVKPRNGGSEGLVML